MKTRFIGLLEILRTKHRRKLDVHTHLIGHFLAGASFEREHSIFLLVLEAADVLCIVRNVRRGALVLEH